MSVREILLLGDENLYKRSSGISLEDHDKVQKIVQDLRDTLLDFRKKYGFGRAIAAPQIGEFYRIIYMNLDGAETVFINPKLQFMGNDVFDIWDDCMSFPGLEVKVSRYKRCKVYYEDINFNSCIMELQGDLAELIQHEYDHLDGILALQRALNNKAFRINKSKSGCF